MKPVRIPSAARRGRGALRPAALGTLDRARTLTVTERVSSVTHLIASLEYLSRPQDREFGGLHHWAATRQALAAPSSPRLLRALDLAAGPRATRLPHTAAAP
ncbi:hypothetical protein ACFZB9_35350 [Kitasatospora sp. NPDC008050]|uniref:hypothetical protein n=1 Tax=Kitasatospora sp. NPDC008050 TaxID=3364021 RepID=UPI0036F18BDA